jgi:hypothetical protein
MKRPLPRLRSGATGACLPQLAHFTAKKYSSAKV